MKFRDPTQRWNQRFSDDPALFGDEPNEWLAAHAHRLAPTSSVCCIADGQGRNGLHLAKLGHRVSSFDLSPVGIGQLNASAERLGVSIDATIAGVSEWNPTAESIDAIVAIYIQFAEPSLRADVFAKISSSLRAGGMLIIEGYGPRQIHYRTGGPGVLDHLYDQGVLATRLPSGRCLLHAISIVK